MMLAPGTGWGPLVIRVGERAARLCTLCTVTPGRISAAHQRKCITAIYWGSSGSNGYGRLPAGFARRRSQLPNDDSFDDNRDDCGPLNYVPYTPKCTYRAWPRRLPAPGSVGVSGSSPLSSTLRAPWCPYSNPAKSTNRLRFPGFRRSWSPLA
jgi:hypothetical protein